MPPNTLHSWNTLEPRYDPSLILAQLTEGGQGFWSCHTICVCVCVCVHACALPYLPNKELSIKSALKFIPKTDIPAHLLTLPVNSLTESCHASVIGSYALCVRRLAFDSRPEGCLSSLRVYVVFINPSRQMLRSYLKQTSAVYYNVHHTSPLSFQ